MKIHILPDAKYVRSTMQLGKIIKCKAAKLWAFLCPGVVKNTEKDRKLQDLHFLNVSEESESPCSF